MVNGLDLFQKYFEDYKDSYVLIGGIACSVLMDEAGAEFRATKDLDIILIAEAVNAEFGERFWDFIKAGKYQNQMKGAEKRLFYRFEKPENQSFPAMLELFSRVPDNLSFQGDGHLTPIPMDEDVSSLSAILLNEDYYNLLMQGKTLVNGLPVLGAEYLIPFKAKAWLDLIERKKQGQTADSRNIKKHKNDVFRLSFILARRPISLPASIESDMKAFIEAMKKDPPDLKSLGYGSIAIETVFDLLEKIFGIG